MTCRERLIDLLETHHVRYRLRAHPPTYTAQEEAGAEHLPGRRVAKVVIALADGDTVMLVLAADRHVDFGAVARIVRHESARLAREAEIERLFPDCDVGAMPPFGHLYGLPVFLDEELAREPSITFLAGTHEESVAIMTEDFERLERPIRTSFSAAHIGDRAA